MIVKYIPNKKENKENNNVTIVTAFYDIGRGEWDDFRMSCDSYLQWMRNILLLDTNIVIYTENKFLNFIETERRRVDPSLKKTKIVIQKLEDTQAYHVFNDSLVDIMSSLEFKSKIKYNVPEMTKPLYNLIMFSKIYFICDAIKSNYFNSEYYIWSDAGCLRDDNPKIKAWPNAEKINNLEKNKIYLFSHHEKIELPEEELHILGQWRFIQGGSFFVPKNKAFEFKRLFTSVVFEYMHRGLVGSDEKILDFCYVKKPNIFKIIKCDWREYFKLYE